MHLRCIRQCAWRDFSLGRYQKDGTTRQLPRFSFFPPEVSRRLVLHCPHALLLVLIEDRSCRPAFSRLSGHPVWTNLTHVIPLCGPLKRETDRQRGNAKQVPTEKEMFQNLTVSFLGKEGREGRKKEGGGAQQNKQRARADCECGTLAMRWEQGIRGREGERLCGAKREESPDFSKMLCVLPKRWNRATKD